MDSFEHGQFMNSSLIRVYEVFLILAVLKQALHGVKLADVVVAEDLAEVAVLMSEHAAAAIGACLGLVEGTAIFGSHFVVSIGNCFEVNQFFVSVCKLAFLSVAAAIVLDPVFAQLSLILLGSGLGFALRDLGSCCGLIRWAARVC